MADNKIDVIETELIDGSIGDSGYLSVTLDNFVMGTNTKFMNGKDYVIAFDVRIDADEEAERTFTLIEGANTHKDFNVSNVWQRVVIPFKSNGDDVIISIPIGSYFLNKIKIEEGTIPTTWSESQNDYNRNLSNVIDDNNVVYDNKLSVTIDGLRNEVTETFYSKDDTDQKLGELSTTFTQTTENFEFQFNQITNQINTNASDTEAQFDDIRKYIRFEDGKILLGQVGNELELRIANDKISFMQNDSEVAYFTSNRLYVVDGEFTNSMKLGNFSFFPRTSGNLSFMKVGE